MDSLYNVIDKSIIHSFDFGDIELEPVDNHKKLNDMVYSIHNVKIPCDTLLSVVYNVKFPYVLAKPIEIDTYPAWVTKNYDTFPNKYLSSILAPRRFGWDPLPEEETGPYGRGQDVIIGLSTSCEKALKFAKFQLISNMNPYCVDLNDDVVECVDSIISHVAGISYEHNKVAFTYNELCNNVENLNSNVFYRMWLSPDNGLIVVDHVSYYKNSVYRTQQNKFSISKPPTAYMGPAVVFTNLIMYKNSIKDKDIESKKKYADFVFRMTEICKAIESVCYTCAMKDNTSFNVIDRSGIMFDMNKHLYYSAASSWALTSNHPNSNGYRQRTLPAKSSIVPFNLAKIKDIGQITTYCSRKSLWVKSVDHPKVVGFTCTDKPYYIIYATGDLEFAVKLLGENAREFIKKKCVFYYTNDKGNTYMQFYTFVWYTDAGMKIIDQAYQENWSGAKIKREIQ